MKTRATGDRQEREKVSERDVQVKHIKGNKSFSRQKRGEYNNYDIDRIENQTTENMINYNLNIHDPVGGEFLVNRKSTGHNQHHIEGEGDRTVERTFHCFNQIIFRTPRRKQKS